MLQAVAKHLYGTLRNSSVVMSNLIGPVEPMALANHPVKGLYFIMSGAPEVTIISSLWFAGVSLIKSLIKMNKNRVTIVNLQI